MTTYRTIPLPGGAMAIEDPRVRTIMNYALNGVVLTDGEGVCLEVNEVLVGLSGRSREELVGRSMFELFEPDDSDGLQTWWASPEKSGRIGARARLASPEGSPVPVEVKAVAEIGPDIHLAILRDLRAELRAQSLLEQSESRYRLLSELTTDYALCFRADDQGELTVEWMTEPALLDFGNSLEEVNARGVLSFVASLDRLRARAALRELLAGEPVDIELRATDRNGSLRWLQCNGRPVDEPMQPGAARFIVAIRDVTDQREAEDRLRIAEARYRGIFENAVEGILQSTFDGRILAANPAAARILGYDSPADLIECVSSMGDVYVDADRRLALVREVKANNETPGFEVEWRRKQGDTVWVSFSVRALRDERGEAVGLEGFVLDITDRKRAEEKLKASERHYRALIENISDSVVLVDREGTIEYVSPSGLRSFGYTAGESLGSDAFRWLHPDDVEPAMALFQEVLQDHGGTRSSVLRVRAGDGRFRWIEAIATNMLEAPEIRAVVFHSRDITERKTIEQAVVDRELRLRLVLKQMPATLWTTDADLRTTFVVGEVSSEIPGDPNWMIGKSIEELFDASEQTQTVIDGHRAALGGDVATYEIEWHGRWWRAHVEPLRNDAGEVVGTIGVATEVTENKLAQEQVERSVQALRAADDERRQLLKRLVTIQEEERTRVSLELHDELGQILTSATLFAKALEERVPATLEKPLSTLRELLSEATASTRRLAWSLHPGDVHAHGLIEALRRLGQSVQDRHGIRVDLRDEGWIDQLPEDGRAVVYRIVQEAVTNAVRHAGPSTISIVATRRPGVASILVEDDGRGFDPQAVMAHSDPTVRMGLVGMQERAAATGCRLVVDSSPGRGTTIRLDIREGT